VTAPRTYPIPDVTHTIHPEVHERLRALLAGEHGQAVEECLKLVLSMKPERATVDYATMAVTETL
jgi:hypothetical protein